MYRFTSTSKPKDEKTFLEREETNNGQYRMDPDDWETTNQMKITIKKPAGMACGVYLPHKDSGEPYYSGFHSDQREVLLPAGTCFRVIKKKTPVQNSITKIEMTLECLGQPSKYYPIMFPKYLSKE